MKLLLLHMRREHAPLCLVHLYDWIWLLGEDGLFPMGCQEHVQAVHRRDTEYRLPEHKLVLGFDQLHDMSDCMRR